MFYVYHGEDEFSRSEEVAQRKQQVMAAGMGDLNITELDGRRLTFEELVNACQAVPFLAERRLVIVHDLLQRFDGARAARGTGRRGTRVFRCALPELWLPACRLRGWCRRCKALNAATPCSSGAAEQGRLYRCSRSRAGR